MGFVTSYGQWPLLNDGQTNRARLNGPRVGADAYSAPADAFITDDQRENAEYLLRQALRDGRITSYDFEQRFTSVVNASSTSQLHAVIRQIPPSVGQTFTGADDRFHGRTDARAYVPRTPGVRSASNGMAALAHISGIFSWVVGPAICYAFARPGGVLRREAAKAFNYQLVAGLLFVGLAMVLGMVGLDAIIGPLWLGWLGLSISGAAKAGSGQDWTNPVNKYTHVAPLPADGR